MRIYCVEDDDSIREIELYALRSAGYEASGFTGADEFFQAVSKTKPDLVILDIMLSGQDGNEILRKLRRDPYTAHIPVIMASALGTEYDKVKSLDEGADDYMAKPFGMMELLSRVKALLRRTNPETEKMITADEIAIYPDRHEVLVSGKPVVLTRKEYDLLVMLISHPGVVYTRDAILDHVWGQTYDGETRTVDVHVRTLRQKLDNAGQHIETIRGVGYRYHEGTI